LKSTPSLVAVIIACAIVGACQRIPGFDRAPPKGQVVATVDGQEITLRELDAVLKQANISDPALRKTAEQAAIQQLIARKVLAEVARQQGLDKSPDFALSLQGATDELLGQSLQAKLAADIPSPSSDEVERFVADHPDVFDQRKIFEVDEIAAAPSGDVDKLTEAFKPIETMDAAEALLQGQHVPYKRAPGEIDALSIDPDTAETVAKTPTEVYVTPEGDGLVIFQVKDVKIVPVTGQAATNAAAQIIRQRVTNQALANQFSELISKASVRYNSAYAPTPKPKA
jgi:EpsD family peptidyl-prolyl cis-trans isomerase